MNILVTGCTGYIGGRIVPRLVELGHQVTVLVRDRNRYQHRPVSEQVRIHQGDLLKPETLSNLGRFDAAYYLVHAMMGGKGFEDRDRIAATNFAQAINDTCHVIYLGGLMPGGKARSRHLQSRAETGAVLAKLRPGRVTEFRAGPVIGSGSASFEMVRYLTERLPVMVVPRWVNNLVQPVSVRDVLAYLVSALEISPAGIVPIGADRLTFGEMMQGYARVRGLPRRWMLSTPVLAPGLASRWVGFFTPIPNHLARPLVQGMLEDLIADTQKASELFPHIEPIAYETAVELALARTEKNMIETRWSGSLGDDRHATMIDQEGLIREVRRVRVACEPERVFKAFSRLGGEVGWPAWNWAWIVRGGIDKLIGGPGLRRGRRDPDQLLEGEAVDFWRVERVDEPHLLRLRAEMKIPGKAWLQWETEPAGENHTTLTQTALFEPKGLAGVLYWYALLPLHALIFSQMIRNLARMAQPAG